MRPTIGQGGPELGPARAPAQGLAQLGWVLVVVISLGGCTDVPLSAPSSGQTPSLRAAPAEPWAAARVSSVLSWNSIARQLVAEHQTDPPMASRYYALLSVAQLAATDNFWREQVRESRQESMRAAVAQASALVLGYAYPDRAAWLRERSAEAVRSDSAAARAGLVAASQVLERARSDRSDLVWAGKIPVGTGLWFVSSVPPQPPLRPRWGEARPWFMARGDQFRPEPPPRFGSDDYETALREVRTVSDTRTPEQVRIAEFWADGAGTATPPGHWNAIAAELVERYHLDERRAAEVMARLNMALMDAGIACWDAKYTYWLIRPPQADPLITTPVGLPNFPSYVSGHATFSGAASDVLAAFFPAERVRLRAMAEEAALSRLYAGIHYRFDNEVGLRMGRSIAAIANASGPHVLER